jgi:hypothetical protein
MVYVPARPVDDTRVIAGDESGLEELRWVSLREAEHLMPTMYEPVRKYLGRALLERRNVR